MGGRLRGPQNMKPDDEYLPKLGLAHYWFQ